MKRRVLAPAACALLVTVAVGGSAHAGGLTQNQYQGQVEKTGGSYIGFDVVRENGAKRIKRVAAAMPYHCRQTPESPPFYTSTKGSLKVKGDGSFSGKLRISNVLARGADFSGTLKVSGRLAKKGKAKGEVDANLRARDGGVRQASQRGIPDLDCYSGRLEWKAKKGAEVGPSGR